MSPYLCQSCFKAWRCSSAKNKATAGGAGSQILFEGVQLVRLDRCKAATRQQARCDITTPASKLLQGGEVLLGEGEAQGRWYAVPARA
jgi:hypothetical protein